MAEEQVKDRSERDRDGNRDRGGDRDRRGERDRGGDRDRDGRRGSVGSRLGAKEAMRSARGHLQELTGRDAESVVHIEADGQRGWRIALEVVELRRIPDTTDLLASYELELDEDGELVGYRRLRRYTRSEQGEQG